MHKDVEHSETKGHPSLLKPNSQIARPRAAQPQLIRHHDQVPEEVIRANGKRPWRSYHQTWPSSSLNTRVQEEFGPGNKKEKEEHARLRDVDADDLTHNDWMRVGTNKCNTGKWTRQKRHPSTTNGNLSHENDHTSQNASNNDDIDDNVHTNRLNCSNR